MAKLTFNTYGNEKQKLALSILLNHSNGITELGYGGWAGWAKSYTGVAWQWMMRNRYAGTRGFLGRKELKRLKQTTLATYFKFCSDWNIPVYQRGIYNAQDSVIRFPNWSEILLLDLAYQPSDPLYQRFGSLELTDWFIDESAEVDEQCIVIINTRIGRQKNEEYWLIPKLLQTFNPDKGHVYRNFYKPSVENNLQHYRYFIPALATDNKKLPASYIEQLKKSDPVTQQRLLYGNFEYDNTPGRLFEYDHLLAMWSNPKLGGDGYISIDVARKGKDKTVIGRWEGLDLVEVIVEKISDIRILGETVKVLAQKHNIWSKRVIVDEDGVGWGLVDILKCQGFINNSKPKQRKSPNLSTTRNFDCLKTQCYFEVAIQVPNIAITPETVIANGEIYYFKSELLEELDVIVQTHLDSDTKLSIIKKEQIKEKIGRSPDYSDMVMLRMFYELDKIEPILSEESREEMHEMDILIFWDDEIAKNDETLLDNPY